MVQPWYTERRISMPSVQRRVSRNGKVRYRALVRLKGHKPRTATFLKKADAVTWGQETETKIRQSKYFPERLIESERNTLGDLLDRYKSEVLPKSRAKGQPGQLEWWKDQLGDYKLKDLTSSMIAKMRDRLAKEQSDRTGRNRTSATVNRYLALLSHAFTIAIKEWQWMAVNPVVQISKPREAQGRTRFLNDEERERLLAICKASESVHLFTIVTLALSTGMRKGEILGLKWENIDLHNRRVTLVRTKNGERRVVPLVGKAYQQIRNLYLKLEPAKDSLLVPSPHNSNQPISIRTAWETALKKADVSDFRFHDLRHSTASYLAMNGASLLEIADILGHKTLQMVKRYSHLSEGHTAAVLERMNKKVFG
jgi:integrase